MKKLLIPLVLLLGLREGISSPVPLFALNPVTVNWRPYQKLPVVPSGTAPSLAVDSNGAAHVARIVQNNGVYELRYLSQSYESRAVNGFGASVVVDSIANSAGGLQYFDIASGPDGTVQLVWVKQTFVGIHTTDTLYRRQYGADSTVSTTTIQTLPQDHRYTNIRVAVSRDNKLHIVYGHDGVTPVKIEHIVYNGTSVTAPVTITSSPTSFPPRFVLKESTHLGTMLAAVWAQRTTNGTFHNGEDLFSARGSYDPNAGTVAWQAPGAVTSTGIDQRPDVDIDDDGGLHYAWSKVFDTGTPLPDPHVYYSKNGAAPTQVSISKLAATPNLNLNQGALIKVSGKQVHLFYDGFSHATTIIDQNNWSKEELLHSPNSQKIRDDYNNDHSKPYPQVPSKVCESRGRFDLVDSKFYIRSYDTIPDGTSMVPAFPGGSVNIVPLSGRFQYRLPLFSTKGVGPCASVGLTYNTKQNIVSFAGAGWTMDHLMTLTVNDDDSMVLVLPSGLEVPLTFDATRGTAITDTSFGFVASVAKLTTMWKLVADGGTEYRFDLASGKLNSVYEPTGNYLEVQYYPDGPNAGMPSAIVDMLGNSGPGRITQLIYGTGIDSRHVVTVKDPLLKEYWLGYSNTATGRQLTSVTFAGMPVPQERPVYGFTYGTNGLMSDVTLPGGDTYTITYDGAGRVITIDDPTALYLTDIESSNSAPINPRRSKFQVKYNSTEDEVLTGGRVHTRVLDRRNHASVSVFDAQNGWAVTDHYDQAAIDATPGIYGILREFDNFRNVRKLTDRWGAVTTYTYRGPTTTAPWLTNLMTSITKQVANPSGPGLVDQLVESFTYYDDIFGNVEFHRTYAGGVMRETHYTYYSNGRLDTTQYPGLVRPDGDNQMTVTSKNEYAGPRMQLSRTINEETHYTDYSSYHGVHGLPQSVLREGGTVAEQTLYDDMGNTTATKRPRGGSVTSVNEDTGWTTFGLDGLYRIHTVTDPSPAAYVTTNSYDLRSRLISVLPPAGAATVTHYDPRGFISDGSTPDGSWFQNVDENGNVRRQSSVRGHFSQMTYDKLDRVESTRTPGDTANAGQGSDGPTWIETNWVNEGYVVGTGERFSVETRLGAPQRITRTTYDNRHRTTRVNAPDGLTVTEYFYNEQDQVVATQLSYNTMFQSATLTFRDARDRVERVRIQNKAYQTVPPTLISDTVTLFNRVGSVVTIIDPLGNPAATSGPAVFAHKTTYILDARERLLQVKDGKGAIVKENQWGEDDLLIETRIPDPATKSTTMVPAERRTWTARKEPKTVFNRDDKGITYAYNSLLNQVDTAKDTLGRIRKTLYEGTSQRASEVTVASNTPNPRKTLTSWSGGLLQQATVWNPDPAAQSYSATYQYLYDKGDRLERFTPPIVSAERYAYNDFGEEKRLTTENPTANKTITHDYNEMGQRKSSQWGIAYSTTETRAYDNPSVGLQTTISNGTNGKVVDYDLWLGTPKLESFYVNSVLWKTQTPAYDVAKNLVSLLDSAGGSHQWIYDENNRVKQVRYGTQPVCDISYTIGGLLDQTTLYNSGGQAIAITTHTYDGLSRRIRQQTVTPAQQVLAEFVWTYNVVNLVDTVKVNHLGVGASFTYNERGELTGENWSGNGNGQGAPPDRTVIGAAVGGNPSVPSNTAEATPRSVSPVTASIRSYDYDPAGNRKWKLVDGVRTDYIYNAASQLKEERINGVLQVSHQYDEWGQEKLRATSQPSVFNEIYVYNYLNLLVDYQKSIGTPTPHWTYEFWPDGDRYARRNANDVSKTELYVPLNRNVVTEYSTVTQLKNSYVQGTGVDSKYVRIPFAGSRVHYIGDQVGTVSATLSDTSPASVAETTLRDVWGMQISQGTSAERYGFAQREHDVDSGLVFMRARMYDPRIGRFTQTDPLLGNRSLAHYAYASNNPISMIDPLGLQEFFTEGVRRNAAASAPPPVEQLPKASDLPTPVRDRYKELADSLEKEQWRYTIPPMRLEPEARRIAIQQLRDPENPRLDGYRKLLGYGAGHLGFAVEAGSVIAGAGPSINAVTENVATIVRAGPPGASSTPDVFAPANDVASFPGDEGPPRPTWQTSESTSEQIFMEFGFKPQVTLKGGQEVPYGTKGGVRPDLFSRDFRLSIDTKNYDLADPQGRANLMKNLVEQTQNRKAQLPPDTRQGVIIDTRGQSVETKYMERLIKRIERRAGIDPGDIIILTDDKK